MNHLMKYITIENSTLNNTYSTLLQNYFTTVSVCVYVSGHVYVVYEDTNLYNDMGMT